MDLEGKMKISTWRLILFFSVAGYPLAARNDASLRLINSKLTLQNAEMYWRKCCDRLRKGITLAANEVTKA